MDNADIFDKIDKLVSEQKQVRSDLQKGKLSPDEENSAIKRIEVALDQCWDLLRQRQGRKDAGENPASAQSRGASEVEGYLQ